MSVNGHEEIVPAGVPLSYALYNRIGLHSVRETCGIGVCGSCTVLIDGCPTSSCLLLTDLVDGADVVTAEGLASHGGATLQDAFVRHEAFQCSFCIPAMTVAAHALLTQYPDADEEMIREHLAGNLCRCGSYPQILEAVLASTRRGLESAMDHGSASTARYGEAGVSGAGEKLARLGFDVADAPAPSAPGLRVSGVSDTLHVAGQIPLRAGTLLATGTVGHDVDLDTARRCAAQAAANALAQLHAHLGTLDTIRIVRMTVFVAATAQFGAHSQVAAAASDLLIRVLGERGRHTRSAIGVASLPRQSPVEIEIIAAMIT